MDAPDFIPDEQMQPDALQVQTAHATSDFIPDDQFESDEEKYGTLGQQAKTGLEGLSTGLIGSTATGAIEKAAGIKEEDTRLRKETNPIVHGIGQAAGLTGGFLTGTGEAAAMTKAGELALEATGLAKAAEGASLGFKVGSAAVQQAAEMAVMQGDDEVAKMMLHDPSTSSQSAIANMGLAAALGGVGGAFMAGAVNPLWEATVGPHVDSMLNSVKNHINGSKLLLPEQAENAMKTLGIETDAVTRAGLSKDPRTLEPYALLREAKSPEVMAGLDKLKADATNSVAESLRIAPEDVASYSENEAGHNLLDTFKKEYKEKYEPIAEALDKRNAEAATISIPDEERLDHYGKLIEEGMEKVGTDSPAYKLYHDWGNRLLAKETIGGIDMLKTELNGEISKAVRAGDTNTMSALRDIRSSLSNFQEQQIEKEAFKSGVKGAGKISQELIAERQAANQAYAKFAKMSDELMDNLGTGRFTGAKGLMSKLADKVTPEQLLNKFSIKGNADFIPFLQEHFPEVLDKVRENELKRMIKPAVLSAKGEEPISIKKLGDIIDKHMAGQKEYVQSILPEGALERIQAAKDLMEAIPEHKSSGTAGWMVKMQKHMPASAMAAIGIMTNHNPVASAILGEAAERLGVTTAPEALRLAYLKFLASDQPIKAEGFKSMVDYMVNTYKGETIIAKASKNLFKAGAQVIADNKIPTEADRMKLDKLVTKIQDKPQEYMNQPQGHLGHYLPDHQMAATESTLNAAKYLANLKPHPHQISPLDKPIPPSKAQEARYHRALDIAQQPAIVLDHIKHGTLQPSDIQDLKSMYPGVYQSMAQKLSNDMISTASEEHPIPYKIRMGVSMFLGQPVDSTMTPASIMAAQPKPNAPQMPNQQQPMHGRKGASSLGKSNNQYRTPGQAAESDRASRD